MITKEVKLSTGVTVTVASVPQKVYDVVRMKHPDPPVPTVQGDLMGEAFRRENRDDAGYQQALRLVEQQRQMAWAEAMLLFGLPDVEVPDNWQPPLCELAYIAPDWKPRDGQQGRKLDYIEWELLRNPLDHQKVIATINALAIVPEEAVDAIEDTFPGDVEVQGARAGDTN
jgi:hypothetical protein